MPSTLDISHLLWEDHDIDNTQWWIEAYACLLQCVAEVSVGQYWTAEGETRVPEVSNLVKTFMNTTEIRIPPYVIRQCWPMLCEVETP